MMFHHGLKCSLAVRLALISISVLFLLCGSFILLMRNLERRPQDATIPTLRSQVVTVGQRDIRVEIAETFDAKTLGLSYRDSLPEDGGMLFIYSKPSAQMFWMHGMRFPLDIVFIRDRRVIQVASDVPSPSSPDDAPAIVQSKEPADQVLEINAGKAKEWGIVEGSNVSFGPTIDP